MEHSGIPAGRRAPLLYPPADMLQADAAAEAFARNSPHLSARSTLTLAQRRWAVRAFAIAGTVGLAAPHVTVLAFMSLAPPLFAAIILFRLFLLLVARTGSSRLPEPETVTPLLPVYTILVALKDEAAVMPQLSSAMAQLDYPEALIDLKLLVEADDTSTREAIEAAHWPANTELVVVPPGSPQTKPRALNYGLARARGTYVVVYDAEDRPHPGQLKAAIAASTGPGRIRSVFRRRSLACLRVAVGSPGNGRRNMRSSSA